MSLQKRGRLRLLAQRTDGVGKLASEIQGAVRQYRQSEKRSERRRVLLELPVEQRIIAFDTLGIESLDEA